MIGWRVSVHGAGLCLGSPMRGAIPQRLNPWAGWAGPRIQEVDDNRMTGSLGNAQAQGEDDSCVACILELTSNE